MDNQWLEQTIIDVLKDKSIEELNSINIEEIVSNAISSTLPAASGSLLMTIKSNTPRMLKEQKSFRRKFESRLYDRWKVPLDLLETLLTISLEGGEMFYKETRDDVKEDVALFEALVRIHARACQISHEILCLLKGGFADGAITRWRTLHELSVLSSFLSEYGNDVAQMYLDYQDIEAYYEMLEYVEYTERLKLEALSDTQMKAVVDRKVDLVKKYGNGYDKPYGWTMNILSPAKRNFKGIEEKANLDHLRPYYKLACNYVHLGPKASTVSLGNKTSEYTMLAGPSDIGLTVPGQNMSISLTQITISLLSFQPSLKQLLVSNMLLTLSKQTCEMFVSIVQPKKM